MLSGLVALLWLSACGTSHVRNFAELPPGDSGDRAPQNATYIAKGDTLTITARDQFGVWLAGVEVKLIGGDVYLDPINISSPAREPIVVDFSPAKFPRDWRNRLYWIQTIASFPFPGAEQTLYRRKIVVAEGR